MRQMQQWVHLIYIYNKNVDCARPSGGPRPSTDPSSPAAIQTQRRNRWGSQT